MLSVKKTNSKKRGNSFKDSIIKLIELCNKDKRKHYNMFRVSTKLNFHKRRFYDVINVLGVIEVCMKIDTETFIWNGVDKIHETFYKIANENGALSKDEPLSKIIPSEDCITISKVTVALILCYIALQEHCLNIKEVAIYLSRDNSKSKTILCKLYQITHVFESIGIVSKTEKTSVYRISSEYLISDNYNPQKSIFPYSIDSLLNKPNEYEKSEIVHMRRKEFQAQQEIV